MFDDHKKKSPSGMMDEAFKTADAALLRKAVMAGANPNRINDETFDRILHSKNTLTEKTAFFVEWQNLGGNIDMPIDISGEKSTLLLYAIKDCRNENDIARVFLDAGANPRATHDDETNPLFQAAHIGDEGLVRRILDSGVSPRIVNSSGDGIWTWLADRNNSTGLDRVLPLIIEAGHRPFDESAAYGERSRFVFFDNAFDNGNAEILKSILAMLPEDEERRVRFEAHVTEKFEEFNDLLASDKEYQERLRESGTISVGRKKHWADTQTSSGVTSLVEGFLLSLKMPHGKEQRHVPGI